MTNLTIPVECATTRMTGTVVSGETPSNTTESDVTTAGAHNSMKTTKPVLCNKGGLITAGLLAEVGCQWSEVGRGAEGFVEAGNFQ